MSAILIGAAAMGGLGAIQYGLSLHGKKKERKAAERSARLQAELYGRQSGIYGQQAGMYSRAAAAYADTAALQEAIGRANAAETMRASAQLDYAMQYGLSAIDKQRRAKIGEGRAAFAANGVLVDAGSAAQWERDEMADAVVEKLSLMQDIENEYYNYRIAAKRQIVEGLNAKAGTYGQAAGMAGQAAGAAAQGEMSAWQQLYALKGAKQGGLTWADWLGAGANIASAAAQGALMGKSFAA